MRNLCVIYLCTIGKFERTLYTLVSSSSCLTSSADPHFFAHDLHTGSDITTVQDDLILHNHTSHLSCLQLHVSCFTFFLPVLDESFLLHISLSLFLELELTVTSRIFGMRFDYVIDPIKKVLYLTCIK